MLRRHAASPLVPARPPLVPGAFASSRAGSSSSRAISTRSAAGDFLASGREMTMNIHVADCHVAAAPGQSTAASGRRCDLDWIRIGAFGLLILYHVGMLYVPWNFH